MIKAVLTGCVAAVAVGVFALSGCSDDSSGLLDVSGVGASAASNSEPLPTPAALAAVVRAARKTLRTGASVDTTVALSGSGTQVDIGPLPKTVRITGVFDFAANSGHLTARVTGRETGSIGEIFLPRTVYITNLPNERPGAWVTARRSSLRAHYIYRTAANDPRQLLEMVADAEEMGVEGHDTVEGTPTIRYRGYLRNETLTRHMSAPDTAKEQNLMGLIGPEGRRIEAWVDGAGRIVRAQLGFQARQDADQVTESVRFDLSRFGAKITVHLPPKRNRVPVHQLAGILLG